MNLAKTISFVLFINLGLIPAQTGAMALNPTGLSTVNMGGRLPHYTTSRGRHDYRNSWENGKQNQKWSIPQFSTNTLKYSGTALALGALGAWAYYSSPGQKEKRFQDRIAAHIKNNWHHGFSKDDPRVIQYIEDNFVDLLAINPYSDFIPCMLSLSSFINCILNNIDAIACHEKKREIVCGIIQSHMIDDRMLQTLIKKCAIDSLDPMIISALLQRRPCNKDLIQKIIKNPELFNDVFIFNQLIACNKKCSNTSRYQLENACTAAECKQLQKLFKNRAKTQTEHHLETQLSDYRNDETNPSYYTQNYGLRTMVNSLNNKARTLENNGYMTFVHGQQWGHQFEQDVYNFLWQLQTQKPLKDFTFVHLYDPKKINNVTQEEQIHTQSIQNGRDRNFFGSNKPRLLFMNYAFFANNGNQGSSTAYYIAQNTNISSNTVSVRNIFSYFGMSNVLTKYKAELALLENEHKQLTTNGNCLLIAVPKKDIEKSIYVARAGGYKDKRSMPESLQTLKGDENQNLFDSIKSYFYDTSDQKKQDSRYKIDEIEFCLPMTNSRYGGLNPESGIKIFSFNAVPQDKWKAYCAKRDALFAQIKADVEKEQKQ